MKEVVKPGSYPVKIKLQKKHKVAIILVAVAFVILGILVLTGVVEAQPVSGVIYEPSQTTNSFVISTYIASGQLYVSVSPENTNLVSGTYQILMTSQGAVDVYNGSFFGPSGTSFTVPAEYPSLLVEIFKGGVVVQEQTVQGTISVPVTPNTSGLPIVDYGILELMFVVTFVLGMLIFEKRMRNENKLADEYVSSMDEGDMIQTKELFRTPAKTKEQGNDRLKMYMWLKSNGYEINPGIKTNKKGGK